MELEKLIMNVKDNMCNLDKYENYYFSIELKLFEKSAASTKFQYEKNFVDKIQNMANYYGQDLEKYEEKISQLKQNYFQYFQKVKNVYDKLFLTCLNNYMNCFNEQKKCVAQILEHYCSYCETKNEEDFKLMNAYAQNKVNYTLIMEECRARLKWCISEFENDINDLYKDEENKIEVINDGNIFASIKKFLVNIFSGKQKFNSFLEKFEKDFNRDLDEKSFQKCMQVISVTGGIMKQVKSVKLQIDEKFKELTSKKEEA